MVCATSRIMFRKGASSSASGREPGGWEIKKRVHALAGQSQQGVGVDEALFRSGVHGQDPAFHGLPGPLAAKPVQGMPKPVPEVEQMQGQMEVHRGMQVGKLEGDVHEVAGALDLVEIQGRHEGLQPLHVDTHGGVWRLGATAAGTLHVLHRGRQVGTPIALGQFIGKIIRHFHAHNGGEWRRVKWGQPG